MSDLKIASLSRLFKKDCQNMFVICYLTLRQCTITLRSTIVRIERACKFPGSVLLKVFFREGNFSDCFSFPILFLLLFSFPNNERDFVQDFLCSFRFRQSYAKPNRIWDRPHPRSKEGELCWIENEAYNSNAHKSRNWRARATFKSCHQMVVGD